MIHTLEIGTGEVLRDDQRYTLTISPSPRYSDAQIGTYRTRRDFHFRPPVTMTLRARADGDIRGTAGFGFWNHPLMPGDRLPRLPKAVWFFYGSPPNKMALAKGVPGHGWKAATFDATRWPFFALLPTAPLGFLMMRSPLLYNRLWPVGQRAIGVSETLLDENLLRDWHEYSLDWQPDGVTFRVDGNIVHQTTLSPKPPLGFVAWIDNQYAIVTPQGNFGAGLVKTHDSQSLLIEAIRFA